MKNIPTQAQLVFPILESMEEVGGVSTIQSLYDQVARKTQIDEQTRNQRGVVGEKGQTVNLFERHVRWAQQRAKLMGLMEPVEARHWRITGKGKEALREAAPGIIITVFETEKGVALFGRAEDAVAYIEDQSLQLIFTSPPYPLLRKKEYGNVSADEYVEWFLGIAKDWPKKLTKDGSLVINLADVWQPGTPTVSLYQERLILKLADELGFRLAQRYAWLNPSKMPAPAEWVTVRRVRVKPSLEQIYWLSMSDHPYADNRAVLRPYSDSMRKRLAGGGEKGALRPSGHLLKSGAFGQDHGGSIPDNLIVAANTESGGNYHRYCRDNGIKIHPASFPKALPEHFLRFLTREGDTVYDPFSGSLTMGEVAERLNRRWIASELHLDYLLGGAGGRFGRELSSITQRSE